MSHIVCQSMTKKQFREKAINTPDRTWVDDPSIFSPVSGTITDVLMHKGEFTVTNHPKRSWFARVYRHPKTHAIVVE